MVYDPFGDPGQKLNFVEGDEKLLSSESFVIADPVARLGAVIIDLFIVLMPIVLLFISPLRKELMESILLKQELEFVFSILLMVFVGLAIFLFYNAILISFWGTTLGRKCFHLEVKNIWTNKNLDFVAAFLRSTIWVGEVFCLMIPFLWVLTDKKRRAPHDKFTDAVVISTKAEKSSEPSVLEITFIKAVIAGFIGLTLAGVGQHWYQFFKANQDKLGLSQIMGEQKSCPEVETAFRQNFKSGDEALFRTQIAMALFAAGEVKKSCLSLETQRYLNAADKESSLIYLAQAFIYSDDPEKSNRYLKQACVVSEASSSCKMSRIVDDWSKGQWAAVDSAFDTFTEKMPAHMTVWAVRHFTKRRLFEKANEYLQQLSSDPTLAGFLSIHRAKILWGLKSHNELNTALNISYEALGNKDRMHLATWMCKKSFNNQGCSEVNNTSCDTFEKSPVDYGDMEELALRANLSRCSGKFNEFKEQLPNPVEPLIAEYLEVLDALEQQQAIMAKNKSLDLLENREAPSFLVVDLNRHIIEKLSGNELIKRTKAWQVNENQNEVWSYEGANLQARWLYLKEYSKAYEVGRALVQNRYMDDIVLKPFVVAAFSSGEELVAEQYVAKYYKDYIPRVSRTIASVAPEMGNDFDKVIRKIRGKRERR